MAPPLPGQPWACDRLGRDVAFMDTSRTGRRHVGSVRCANQVNVSSRRLRQRHARTR